MTFVQRRNRLTTHFSEGTPIVKRRMSVHKRPPLLPSLCQLNPICPPYGKFKILSSILSPCEVFRLRSLPFSTSSRKFSVFLTSRPSAFCTWTFPVVTLTKGVTEKLWYNNRRTVKTCVFWHMTRCTVVDKYQRFGGLCCLFHPLTGSSLLWNVGYLYTKTSGM